MALADAPGFFCAVLILSLTGIYIYCAHESFVVVQVHGVSRSQSQDDFLQGPWFLHDAFHETMLWVWKPLPKMIMSKEHPVRSGAMPTLTPDITLSRCVRIIPSFNQFCICEIKFVSVQSSSCLANPHCTPSYLGTCQVGKDRVPDNNAKDSSQHPGDVARSTFTGYSRASSPAPAHPPAC